MDTLTDKHILQPIIGFLGMVLIAIGCTLGNLSECIGLPVIVIGVCILVYALFTGNIKFWG